MKSKHPQPIPTEQVVKNLMKEANKILKDQGHRHLEKWNNNGTRECKDCGAQIVINPMPMLSEMTVYGSASSPCPKKV